MRKDQRNQIRAMTRASTVGLVLVISIVIGYLFGSWLDSKFGTEPWLMLLFIVIGAIAGFVEIFRMAKQLSENDE